MKSIYLPAFEFVNFEDIGNFLVWLGAQRASRISMVKLQKSTQVRATKLGPLLRLLEQFSFVVKEPDAISISPSGLKFCRAQAAERKVMVKNQFVRTWPFHDLLSRLETDGIGRLTKNEVLELLKLGTTAQVTDQMVVGVMAWGHCCDLFYFDEAAQVISRFQVVRPFPSEGDSVSLRKGA